ncbi:hypothetical protein [Synechococcus sp. PCC 6312]|uniref:hypothetical protein n=1 Tax=Synechococcus sp. (strain ATCC 27167 / PCC 6312) TaxID=195253 RepID=UPI00029F2955|nr:hypothetical protein [Synechococcus sp. PCC 6312]AFY61075.1 hypothetical protein Syn6312_1937 [Synechococcus sp. PCC 6312]
MLAKSKLLVAISGTSILIGIAALTQFYGKTTAESSNTAGSAHAGMNHGMAHHEADTRPGDDSAQGNNGHSSHGNTSISPTVRLVNPEEIPANKPTALTFKVEDQSGQAIKKFDVFQEKLMHLIAVNRDLNFFEHLHPEYQGDGIFSVTVTLPEPGNYVFFADYKPAGESEVVSVLKTAVPGTSAARTQLDLSQNQVIGNTTVGLELNPMTVKAGEPVNLTFNLRDSSQNQPIPDLQPYLGEWGHLVILRRSDNLSRKDYIHAHATTKKFSGDVNFATVFPQAGMYKLWGQFNRNGQIITSGFWVKVP